MQQHEPEPCQFRGYCEGYFKGSHTCEKRKKDCKLFGHFAVGNITEFKLETEGDGVKNECVDDLW
jgi:hypothetical protein